MVQYFIDIHVAESTVYNTLCAMARDLRMYMYGMDYANTPYEEIPEEDRHSVKWFYDNMMAKTVSVEEQLNSIEKTTFEGITTLNETYKNLKDQFDITAGETITYIDGKEFKLPISSKQSYVRKVAVAEFDLDTICDEAGIDNARIRELMRKFQVAKSAKGLTESEKTELKNLLQPYARNLVRWAITGSPEKDTDNVVFPKLLVKFKICKPKDRFNIKVDKSELHYQAHSIYTIDEYIDLTMKDKNGKIRSGGFGTGLSWTYASGSGGRKIQFKA